MISMRSVVFGMNINDGLRIMIMCLELSVQGS